MNFVKSTIICAFLSCSLASCVSSPSKATQADVMSGPEIKTGNVEMINADALRCQISSAKLTIVGEDVFTRTAITEATIEKYGQTMSIPADDPRIIKLSQILADAVLGNATLDKFEPRMMILANCADGTTRKIIGSRLSSDNVQNLDIDGQVYSTVSSLRAKLEALLPPKN